MSNSSQSSNPAEAGQTGLAPELSTIPEASWEIARRREAECRRLLELPHRTASHMRRAAKKLGLSVLSCYRLLARYRDDQRLTTLLPPRLSASRRSARLPKCYESIIEEAIISAVKNAPRINVLDIYRTVNKRCMESGLKAVSRNAVSKRVADLNPVLGDRRKRIAALGRAKRPLPRIARNFSRTDSFARS